MAKLFTAIVVTPELPPQLTPSWAVDGARQSMLDSSSLFLLDLHLFSVYESNGDAGNE